MFYWNPEKETKITLAVPKLYTMHASFAVFPLMTVTLVGVVGAMKGARVVEVLGVPLLDVGSPILLAAKLGHWRKLLAVTPMNQTKHKYPWGIYSCSV